MGPIIYVRISKNRIHLRDISSRQEITVTPDSPFTTARLLVGEFVPYESGLKKRLAQLVKKGIFRPAPTLVVHATEMNQGGLCELERRVLQEGALGMGAKKAVVYEGASLSDQQVLDLVK